MCFLFKYVTVANNKVQLTGKTEVLSNTVFLPETEEILSHIGLTSVPNTALASNGIFSPGIRFAQVRLT